MGPDDHEHRINKTLGVIFRREGFEVVDNHTPLAELIAREDDTPGVDELRQENFNRLLNYFFEDGPHPGCVIRRVFAVAYSLKPSLIAHMNQTDMAKMLGEGKAAMSWRINKVFSGYLKSRGQRGYKAPGQKTETACRKYAAVQAGNQNRRKAKLKGKEKTKHDNHRR